MKVYLYLSDMDATSIEDVLDFDDVNMTTRSSLDKSTTAVLEGERSHSNKNMDSITPYSSQPIDDLDIKVQLRTMSLEAPDDNLLD